MFNPFKFFKKEDENGKLLEIKTSDKKKAVDVLLEESKLTQSFYFMLIFSSVIIIAGILLNQIIIVLAGMLVTPLLTPILTLALGIVVFDIILVLRSFRNILVSIFIIISLSTILSFLYQLSESVEIKYLLEFNFLYLIIAFFSGMAATLAWTKKNLSKLLSGVAITISLVPPIGIMGIYLSMAYFEKLKLPFKVFIFNFLAIIIGSMIIFLLQKFYKVRKTAQKELKEEQKEEAKNGH